MASKAEVQLFDALEVMHKRHREEAFVSWREYYNMELGELFNLAQHDGSMMSYNQFCRWIYCNTDSPIKTMKKDKQNNVIE